MPVGTMASAVHIVSGAAPGVATFVAIGAKSAGGTATLSIAHPAGTAADQILIAGRCTWRSAAECDPIDEASWTNSGELAGGTGTAVDAHTTIIRADHRELTGTLAGPTTFDQTGTPSTTGGGVGVMASYAKVSGSWSVATATGDDNNHAANRSVTASTTIAFEPGDTLVAIVANDTDTSMTVTSPALTASGITFGTTTRRTSGAGVGTGNDGGIELFDATVTAGSGTVAPVLNFTTATTQCGPVAFVRLRGGPAVAPGAPVLVSAAPGDTFVTLTWTAGSTGGSAITGYLVEQSPTGLSGWSTVTTTGAVLTYNVTGLTNDTIVYFRVSAVNAIGTSAASNVISTTPTAAPSVLDSFDRADTTPVAAAGVGLGSNWEQGSQGGGGDGYHISSNSARQNSTFAANPILWTTAMASTNHEVSGRIAYTTTQGASAALILRMPTDRQTYGYYLTLMGGTWGPANGNVGVYIGRFVSETETVLVGPYDLGVQTGEWDLRLTAVGTTLTAFVDGVQQLTTTDSTHTTGTRVGFRTVQSTAGQTPFRWFDAKAL